MNAQPAFPLPLDLACAHLASFAGSHDSDLVERLARAMAAAVGPDKARRVLALAAERAGTK